MRKNRKKLWVFFIIIFLLLFLFLLTKFLLIEYDEQIQCAIKNRVITKVEARKEELNDIIAEMSNPEFPKKIDHWLINNENIISYTELDNDRITNIYNDLSLMYIRNHMGDSECDYVYFIILQHPVSLVWHGEYYYGFYYIEEDRPIDIFSGKIVDNNTKVYVNTVDFEYWYRTEKIADNWWYFEVQITYKFPDIV